MTFDEILDAYQWERPSKLSAENSMTITDPESGEEFSPTFHIKAPEVTDAAKEGRLWTVIYGDNLCTRFLAPGFHYINRDCYMISKQPIRPEHQDHDYQIDDDEDDDLCESTDCPE